jgi:hypothetical protein
VSTSPHDPRDGSPPPWAGAPGFTPGVEGVPHAPLPGAPPYPESPEHAPPPVGQPPRRTRFLAVLGAAAVWAVVNLVLVFAVAGSPPGPAALGEVVGALVVPTLLAALVVWMVARRRAWGFWLLLLVAAPLFWVLRAIFIALPPG